MAYVRQEVINALLQRQIDEHATLLADRTTDSLDQLRINQGIIQGLKIALVVVEASKREEDGE